MDSVEKKEGENHFPKHLYVKQTRNNYGSLEKNKWMKKKLIAIKKEVTIEFFMIICVSAVSFKCFSEKILFYSTLYVIKFQNIILIFYSNR